VLHKINRKLRLTVKENLKLMERVQSTFFICTTPYPVYGIRTSLYAMLDARFASFQ